MDGISALLKEYRSRYPEGEYREAEPMSAHTSFRIGGPVKVMFLPRSAEETAYIAASLKNGGVRTLVMGNGTDLLVFDGPLDMAVIKLGGGIDGISRSGNAVTAGAGALLAKVSAFARENSLRGLEFACGIPGSVGGAVYMNAGAYGGEIKNVLKNVTALDEALSMRTYETEECALSYRHSRFSDGNEIIISAELQLHEGDREEIGRTMDALILRRKEKQPVDLPSAGSVFKRPKEGYAASLIEEAGLKGLRAGGAQVSPKHAGFIVNTGGAAFDDVVRLMELVRETVRERSGVELEPEIRIIR